VRSRPGSLPSRVTWRWIICVARATTCRSIGRLAALLGGLAEREREILALKYGAGLTNRAIARLTGLGESNVGTLLHRTVQKLRAEWPEASDGRS
jgi:DNA-directed RNA polymerase specialized sigma24 family protein